jgi:hypothetical protein
MTTLLKEIEEALEEANETWKDVENILLEEKDSENPKYVSIAEAKKIFNYEFAPFDEGYKAIPFFIWTKKFIYSNITDLGFTVGCAPRNPCKLNELKKQGE